ncbi:hypothetical protein RDWZM_008309, partial [Blomia tropicalis]
KDNEPRERKKERKKGERERKRERGRARAHYGLLSRVLMKTSGGRKCKQTWSQACLQVLDNITSINESSRSMASLVEKAMMSIGEATLVVAILIHFILGVVLILDER